jgi:hypothetical protein
LEKTDTSNPRDENAPDAANSWRSRAWSPIATAGRGVGFDVVEMIPNGRFAKEKWLDLGMGNHDFKDAILLDRCSIITVASSKVCEIELL